MENLNIIKKLEKYLYNKRFKTDDDIICLVNKFLLKGKSTINSEQLFLKGRPENKIYYDDDFQDYEKMFIVGNKKEDLFDFTIYYAKGRCNNIILEVAFEEL